MTLVRDIMSSPVLTALETETLAQVAERMLKERVGGLPVLDAAGRVKGFFTESDFCAKRRSIAFSTERLPTLFEEWLSPDGVDRVFATAKNIQVKDFMKQHVITISESDPVSRALELMLEKSINRIPVVKDEKLVGIIARHDILKLMLREP